MDLLTVTLPTLVIWALGDIALPPGLIEGLDQYVRQLTLHKVPGASHWIVHEQPGHIADLIDSFLHQ